MGCKYESELAKLYSLLAYSDPEQSPNGRLLLPDAGRAEAAQCLNEAILDYNGKGTQMSTLELVLRQGQLAMTTLGPFYRDIAVSRIARSSLTSHTDAK